MIIMFLFYDDENVFNAGIRRTLSRLSDTAVSIAAAS
jgi:hypothetical protein